MEKNSQILSWFFFFPWTFPFLLFHPSPCVHIYICSSFPVKCSNKRARVPGSKDLLSVWGHGRVFGGCMPRPAFSGSATLKTTVKHNIILTNRAGEGPWGSAEIICGLVSFFFHFFFLTVKKRSFFSFQNCSISSTDVREMLKCFKQDVLYKDGTTVQYRQDSLYLAIPVSEEHMKEVLIHIPVFKCL